MSRANFVSESGHSGSVSATGSSGVREGEGGREEDKVCTFCERFKIFTFDTLKLKKNPFAKVVEVYVYHTASIDEEHELFTEMSWVSLCLEDTHHRIGLWICWGGENHT